MKGFVSTALFILVMFAGALSKKWGITKKLLRVRAEMAILASILILPHFIIYTYKFLVRLFNWKALILAVIIYLLSNHVKKTKKLHPVFFIVGSAIIGILFGFAR